MNKKNYTKFCMLILFEAYSYAGNLLYLFLEIMPGIFRKPIFWLIFKKLGRGCLLDYKCYFRFSSRITIGNYVAINRGCEFYATYLKGGADILIGDHVTFSPHVRLHTAAHDYTTLNMADKVGTIVIEDYAWLGSGVIVLPGVRIGRGAVIGAGAVVTKDVPPFSVCAGIPAKVVRKRLLK
jgi:acetyltransferase-like isoleucine patch superfamily enzyme